MSDQKKEYALRCQSPPDDNETRSLPEGWTRQFDSNSNAWFYVDTLASPRRSIWVHPYDDPQYLESHPYVKDYDSSSAVPNSTQLGYEEGKEKSKAPEKRGLLGKLKDKVVEREEARHLREEQQQRHGKPVSVQPQSSRQGLGGHDMVAALGGGLLLSNMIGSGSGGHSGGGSDQSHHQSHHHHHHQSHHHHHQSQHHHHHQSQHHHFGGDFGHHQSHNHFGGDFGHHQSHHHSGGGF